MSIDAIRWAYDQVIDPGPKATLVAMSWFANPDYDWRVFCTNETLSRMTCNADRTVRRHKRYLAAKGLITETDERAGKTGRIPVCVVHVHNPVTMTELPNPVTMSANPVINDTQSGHHVPHKGSERKLKEVVLEGIDQDVWKDYVEHRKQLGKKMTPLAMKKQQAFLQGHSSSEQYDIVDQSIRNGWIGLFELRAGMNGSSQLHRPKSKMQRAIDAAKRANP